MDGKVISSPEKLAEAFNNVFLDKVENLKKNISDEETLDPKLRLANSLRKKFEVVPEFELRPITKSELRKYVKKMKGNRSAGIEMVDSYSLKLAV